MLISHETPISMLDVSRYYNDYDYCLVHLLPEHSAYKDFYFESVKQGRHVLLDNSIFELGEAYNSDEFAKWISELQPTEYIIPDKLEDTQGTISSFENFRGKYCHLPGQTIGVVQGKSFKELSECYKFMASRVNKIAISFDYSYYLELENENIYKTIKNSVMLRYGLLEKDLQNKWCKYALGRLTFLSMLEREDVYAPYKRHHLLGCSVPWEFDALKFLESTVQTSIETIDTSNPIVAGILGKRYEERFGLLEKWSCKLVDYISAEVTDKQIQDIQHNVLQFRQLCR